MVQPCTAGAFSGGTVIDCYRARVTQNTITNVGNVGILDTNLVDVAGTTWTPSGTSHAYQIIFDVDPATSSGSLLVNIDGAQAANLNASNLGTAGGIRQAILLSQARLCSYQTTQR